MEGDVKSRGDHPPLSPMIHRFDRAHCLNLNRYKHLRRQQNAPRMPFLLQFPYFQLI